MEAETILDVTSRDFCTLCSATLISEENERATYIKHRCWGPRQLSCNTHTQEINWPEYTETRCCYHHYPINGPPIPMAIKYKKKTNLFIVEKAFCCPSCLLSHIVKEFQGSYNFSTLLEMNMMMLRTVFGVKGNVYMAPDVQTLEGYGGHLTDSEYRSKCIQATLLPKKAPFLSFSMVFEEMKIQDAVPPPSEPLREFETIPDDMLQATPSDTQGMVFKIRGLRIPARKKTDKPLPEEDSFNQSQPLYSTFLEKKTQQATKRRRPARKKKDGGMMNFTKQVDE